MKVTITSPNYPDPVVYDERVIRWIVRVVNEKSTMTDAIAAQQALEEVPGLPVCVALQATMEIMHGMVSSNVANTMFHVDLDEDGKIDVVVDDVGELMRHVSGKAAGKLKKESAQHQRMVREIATMLE